MIPAWLRYGTVAATSGALVWFSLAAPQIAGLERDLTQQQAQVASAARHAERMARIEETRRQTAVDKVTQDAQKDLDAAVRRERAAADLRVRDAVATYAVRHRPTQNPDAAPAGQTAGDPLGLLAELLGELDDMAGAYAAAADRARIAGLACERAYDSLAPGTLSARTADQK